MTREELKEHCKRQIQQFERVEKIMPVTLNDWKRYEEHKLILELLEQEPRKGKWIYDDEYSDWILVKYNCSCCKREIIVPREEKNEVYKNYPYCHCGAKMIEPQESKKREDGNDDN